MEDPLLASMEADAEGLASEPRPARRRVAGVVLEDLLSPLLGTSVLLPFAVAFTGVIVTSNPGLEPHMPTLLSSVLLSQALGSLSFSYLSAFTTCTNVDLLSAAFFGAFGRLLRREAEAAGTPLAGTELLVNMLVAQGLFTLLVGLLLILVAHFDGIWYLRFLPYPVACGFVSGIGLIVMDGSFELGCDHGMQQLVAGLARFPPQIYVHAGATILVGLFFLALKHLIHNAMRLPVGVLLVTLALHGGAFALGRGETDLREAGFFLDGLQAESWTTLWTTLSDGIGVVHAGRFLSQPCISLTVSYALLHLISYPFYASGMAEVDKPEGKLDLRKEVRRQGLVHLGLALFAGVPACHSYKVAIVMKSSGAKTRLWVVLLGLTFLCLFFDTAIRSRIAVVPKCAFGGLVFSLGLDFLRGSLVDSRQRVAPVEWRAVVFTALVTWFNVFLGIVFGCLLMMAVFVVEYAGITGIVRRATLEDVRSLADRTLEQVQLLQDSGEEVVIFWCSGYIFFGTAANIVEEVVAYLDEHPCTRHVILDFESVPAVDASGVHAITDFAADCCKRKPVVQVCFCGLVRRLKLALGNVVEAKAITHAPRLESQRLQSALEWAEGQVLARAARKSGAHLPGVPSVPSLPAAGGAPVTTVVDTVWPGLSGELARPAREGQAPALAEVTGEAPRGPEGSGAGHGRLKTVGETLLEMLSTVAPGAPDEELEAVAQRLAPFAKNKRYTARGDNRSSGMLFAEGSAAKDLLFIVSGSVVLSRSIDPEPESHKLPRHHLNQEKGDVFAFEERTEVRIQRAGQGAMLGAIEFGAAPGGVAAPAPLPERVASAEADPECEVLRVPYTELHAALALRPAVGHAAMARLGQLASLQVLQFLKDSSMKPYRLTAPPAFARMVSLPSFYSP